MGVAAARLRGPYLAGATLMLGVALPSLAYAKPGIFGGDQGLNVLFTAPGFLGATFPLTRWQAWVSAIVAIVTVVLPEEAETGPARPQPITNLLQSATDIRQDLADFDHRFGLPPARINVIPTLAGSTNWSGNG